MVIKKGVERWHGRQGLYRRYCTGRDQRKSIVWCKKMVPLSFFNIYFL